MADVLVAPSILSADFARLADELGAVERAGADWIHVDVMDGAFVPNITIGPLVVAAAHTVCSLPLDVHLMIAQPERFLAEFVAAGASVVSVHVEACTHLERTLRRIRELGAKAGVVLNPHTPEHALRYLWDAVDLVLVMSVNPGFGGQRFLPAVLDKVRAIRAEIDARGLDVALEIDGGVTAANAAEIVAAGARVLVAGSAVFGARPEVAAPSLDLRAAAYRDAIASLRAGDARSRA